MAYLFNKHIQEMTSNDYLDVRESKTQKERVMKQTKVEEKRNEGQIKYLKWFDFQSKYADHSESNL